MADTAMEGRTTGIVAGARAPNHVRAVLATSFGNLVEWYDVYAYTAFALYFAGSFFPKGDPVVQQLSAATLFAVAFLMRPIGSIIFGYLADRYGRRSSLTVSILMMCFGSLLIAVAPTYGFIGIWATVILSAARIVQGLSQGGEYGTSVTYLSEISPPQHRGFYSGVWYVTIVKAELFPTAIRALGAGLPYAFTAAIFGGSVDSVALQFKDSGNESGSFWYATALIAVSLVVYLWLPDTRKNSPLDAVA